MDGLSLAASVVGLISLAIQVAPTLRDFFSEVKSARDDTENFSREIDAFRDVAQRLYELLTTNPSEARHFDTTASVLVQTISSSENCLRELEQLLKSPGKDGSPKWSRKLYWPFCKKRMENIISRLGRYNQLLQFSLTIEGCAILSQTPGDVSTLLQLQVDASKKLHEITKNITELNHASNSYLDTANQMTTMLEGVCLLSESSDRLIDLQENVGHITRRVNDERDMKILGWLSSDQYSRRHHEIRSKRTPGTAGWIFRTPYFCEWLDRSSTMNLIWYTGAPGSGKTTLVSFIIDELRNLYPDSDIGISYYYCDYRTRDSEPLVLAMGSILRMLAERLDMLPDSLQRLFETSIRKGHFPAASELEIIIHELCSSLSRCFILIDAMDEFCIENPAQNIRLIKLLDNLAQLGVKVLVTSRTPPATSLSTDHIIEKYSAKEADIRAYITDTLQKDELMDEILNSKLAIDIGNCITHQANGTFLLAVLHLQTIRGQVTRSGVRKALSKLTSDLGEAYDKTFDVIRCQSQRQQQLAFDALMWVAYAYRPLESLELRHALATDISDKDLDDDNIPSIKLIMRSCCGLLAVDELENDSSEVRLVHHTLQPYTQNHKQFSPIQVHTTATQICLTYLLFASTRRATSSNSCMETQEDVKKYTFVRYARDYWGYHAYFSPLETYRNLAVELLMDHNRLEVLYPENKSTAALHIVAGFGLTDLARLLLDNGCTVHTLDHKWESPLNKACANDHVEMASLLLDCGDDPSNQNLMKASPLFTAVTNNNAELAKLLIERGAIIDLHCKDGWTALHKAVDCGYSDLVHLLIDYGSDLFEASSKGVTGLHRAAGRGYTEIMELFIARGVPVDITTYDNWTPLHGAASSGQTEAVKLLLRRGANVRHRSIYGETALHRACQGGYLDTVKALLKYGAMVSVKDSDGDNPLHIAVKENHVEVVTCLLEISTQPLSQLNSRGWSPLQEAQLHGYRRIEKLFRERHPDLVENEGNDDSLTAAIESDDPTKISRLLQDGTDIETRDDIGRTILHRAFQTESYNVARGLLEAGADVYAMCDMDGWQPIHFAALGGKPDAVGLCLDYGADVNSLTKSLQTPLHLACRNGNEETVKLLLDRGAKTETWDEGGRRPLHMAASAGHKSVVIMVINYGAKTVIFDRDGLSVQGCAAERGHHSLVEFLREITAVRPV